MWVSTQKYENKFVIECSGGVVTSVYCNARNVEVTLVDWDDVSEGDDPVELTVAPLANLPDETRELLK